VVGPVDFWTLAELRYHIRCFLRIRETTARAKGVEPQQYLLMLQVRGLEGRRPATIGTLAERLQVTHHSTVELVDRLVRRGMLERRRTGPDRRAVVVRITPKGARVVRSIARHSVSELQTEGPALVAVLRRLIGGGRGSARRRQRRRKKAR
jgi:DNA-binding MarR family transcriptional regulator